MKLQFIIQVKNKLTKRQYVRYNFLELYYTSLRGFDMVVSFDSHRSNVSIYDLSKTIVSDWAKLQIARKDDFVYGASEIDDKIIFHTELVKESLIKIIEKIISSKFNTEFINQYTGEEYKLLFTLSFDMGDEICELTSSTIEEL